MFSLRAPWKQVIAILFFTVAASLPKVAFAAMQAQETPGETVRIMVKVDPASAQSDEMSIQTGFTSAQDSSNPLAKVGWEVIEVDAAHAPSVLVELQTMPGVIEATPDYPLELAWNPNDPSLVRGEQWALDKLGTDVAWEFSVGQAITVAVIDSGIDLDHPDLKNRIVPGYNFIDDNSDTTDQCGHGTHVAGIIAAEANNAIGVAGVANQAVIMPIKVIGENCLGSYSRLMKGILYAVDQGVRVISITSGGGYDHSGLHDAIIYARSQGVLVAVAAGNHGNALPFYPGSFEEAFTVAGTDVNDQQYGMSNYGEQIDISAPATNILSTYWNADESSTYAYMTGTSMATPHVAAVAALILAMDPKMSLKDLESALTSSATDLGSKGWDEKFGVGRLTAWRAVATVGPLAGNVRLGHFRVPKMDTLKLGNVTIEAAADSIKLSWTQEAFASDHSIVIYRSIVPVFEAAEDIDEIAASAKSTYTDRDVEAEQEYYYWLVEADNDVEIAITDSYNTMLTSEPTVPTQPEQPVPLAVFMPYLQR